MGIIWRSAMPLLSTLAALVIIVHSAEEDLDREYRYDLRPRVLDTDPGSYEQPWRVMKAEPPMKHTTENIWSQDSQEEPPKRRRKRKRRPIETSGEDVVTQERFAYPESSPRVNQDADYENAYQTTEVPRRRRKRINARNNRWGDETIQAERPIRRRGNGQKRPSLEPWPKLSEFSGQRRGEMDQKHMHEEIVTEPEQPYPHINNDEQDTEPLEPVGYHGQMNIQSQVEAAQQLDDQSAILQETNDNEQNSKLSLQENKSLSEFSVELKHPHKKPKTKENLLSHEKIGDIDKRQKENQHLITSLKAKHKNKIVFIPNFFEINEDKTSLKKHIQKLKCKYKTLALSRSQISLPKKYRILRSKMGVQRMLEDEAIFVEDIPYMNEGPLSVTLKEVLKQSNGSSLSEILQQHNLTLIDLLHNKENAIKVLRSGLLRRKYTNTEPVAPMTTETKEPTEIEALKTKNPSNNVRKDDAVINVTIADTQHEMTQPRAEENKEKEIKTLEHQRVEIDEEKDLKSNPNGGRYNNNRRRFPVGMRRKLRMRPMINNTYKSPLSRDMAALGLKRFPNRRNLTKSQEWKSMIPLISTTESINQTTSENETELMTTTTAYSTTISETNEDTTIVIDFDKPDPDVITVIEEKTSDANDSYIEIPSTDITEAPTTTSEYPTTTMQSNITETPIVTPILKELNSSIIRRRAYNNRLKKKRLKQKNSTTESPQNDVVKNLFGLGSLVSSSELIAQTTVKKHSSIADKDNDALEDFITTNAATRYTESSTRSTKPLVTSVRPKTTTKVTASWRPTEETAEFEIEELLNDTRTSARLSRILMERNMTLNELVEHRERGSSHVHLADIFHNASREPNPPEPFLSKSLIEPISKETYPLRALLDAKHDPAVKATTIDPIISQTNYIQNIPVVMDFGNNVNENAENMGIMSLFNNFTNSAPISHTTVHDPEDERHVTNSIVANTTDDHEVREGRKLNVNHEMVSWNDIFSMIRKGQTNGTEQTEHYTNDVTPSATHNKKITLEEDVDGDGLIVLEDLQHLRDFDSNIASSSDEKLEVTSYEREGPRKPGILNIPGNTKSVTVATASIVGLSMVLFLLTYAAFKWIQQKRKQKKRNFPSERIPTPVFENRKGHKNNSSTRSISPMLSSSNIYTMNTLESHHGKDSPEYMWDTLRKPFQ